MRLNDLGSLEDGRLADLVVLDDDLHVTGTLVAGERAWAAAK
jgi:N-acetylglucosamine-6-phosphate deacetylase